MSIESSSNASRAYLEWLRQTPGGTKFLTALVLVVSAVGFAFGAGSVLLVPLVAVSEMQVSRMVYSSFCEASLFGFVTTLAWLNYYGKHIETEMGTKEYLTDLLSLIFLSSAAYIALAYVLCSLGICVLLVMPVGGMFPYIISMVMKHPKSPTMSIFGLMAIPTQYFPFAIIAFVAVLSNTIPFNLIVPIAIAYAQSRGFLRVDNHVHCLSVINKVEELVQRFVARLNGRRVGGDEHDYDYEDSHSAGLADLESQQTREAKRAAALEAALSRAERERAPETG